jgi:hypothetical protein
MTHTFSGPRVAQDCVPDTREAVLDHVKELRALLEAQPPAVRRNLNRCIVNAEESLINGSPDAAAHLRRLHETADFVSEMRSSDPTSVSLSMRAKALQRNLMRPTLITG